MEKLTKKANEELESLIKNGKLMNNLKANSRDV